ncbi:hypothetical protein PUNSTDRAFT_81029 [Punctularia strigosozonata HHB-11173 SS5]|uniref:uncharacterized protein n=1 Tax=Punctularia strigosozonata (strain HHB-11173) TaxID=741275 RepID=UPI0004416255|nr:uncharacterized protein PUNSTDRAFT_81029 [Punctularia strigosozonata HHB-11173 SS5]EIN14565.1 hypothetical protein PUNSTDRAFT_81029 [Punctularia strigosozonata HHB-11173 SS5]
MDVDMPEAKPAASSSVSLPRRLTKPAFKPINREAIRAADPELADTPTPYIQLRLAEHGNAMYKVLQSVEASAPERKEEMPKEVKIVVNDVKTAELPTHILGVYRNWALPGESNKRVDLYPAHHIMLAAHCSNLPPIPAPPAQSAPEEAPATITVPFLPICIPSPQTFPLLLTYIYTGREDALYSALLPMPVPSYPPTATTEEQARIDQEFSALLARSFPAAKLLEWAMRVNGLWRNTCTLGVDLDDLWTAIDLCWVLLLDAIAISTGGPRVSRF